MNDLRVFSFGGGWQSIATMLLQIEGNTDFEPYHHWVYANVDDRAEPETVAYMNNVLLPYSKQHGIDIVTVQRQKHGKPYGLLDDIYEDNKSVPIPMWNKQGAPNSRICTSDWKIKVVDKWIKTLGATHVTLGLGISMDESERMKPHAMSYHDRPLTDDGTPAKRGKFGFLKRIDYPLIQARLWRENLPSVFERHGLPTPPKSACFFCPFSSRSRWIELKRSRPDLFEQAIKIESVCNQKRSHLQHTTPFLHVSRTPLINAVGDQLPLWDMETGGGCNSGSCFT